MSHSTRRFATRNFTNAHSIIKIKNLLNLIPIITITFLYNGCISYISPALENTKLPKNGNPVPVELWEKVDAASEDQTLYISKTKTFPGIFNIRWWNNKHYFDVNPDKQRAIGCDYNLFRLGLLELYFPLYHRTARYYYERDKYDPEKQVVYTYTPFFTTVKTKGEFEDLKIEAKGIPLLWSQLDYRGPHWHLTDITAATYPWMDNRTELKQWKTLWGLGPAKTEIKIMTDVYEPDFKLGKVDPGKIDKSISEKKIVPLNLLGLGQLFWSHADRHSQKWNGIETHQKSRGPLNIYRKSTYKVPKFGEQMHQNYFWGVLWQNYRVLDAEAKIIDSKKGPFWGIFGYGKKQQAKAIYLFWFPIKLEKSPEEQSAKKINKP